MHITSLSSFLINEEEISRIKDKLKMLKGFSDSDFPFQLGCQQFFRHYASGFVVLCLAVCCGFVAGFGLGNPVSPVAYSVSVGDAHVDLGG